MAPMAFDPIQMILLEAAVLAAGAVVFAVAVWVVWRRTRGKKT